MIQHFPQGIITWSKLLNLHRTGKFEHGWGNKAIRKLTGMRNVAIIQFEMAQTRGPLLPLGSQLSRQILNGCSDHLANPRTPTLSLEVRCCSNEPNCPWVALVTASEDETMMEMTDYLELKEHSVSKKSNLTNMILGID